MVDKNQTLKSPIDFFSDFLEKIGTSEKGTVLVNINHYKRGIYNGSIQEFFERMYPFYYDSKKHYVDFNKVTYSKFITVLRQISHKNQVAYEYKIKYNHSKHYIEYTFTLPAEEAEAVKSAEAAEAVNSAETVKSVEAVKSAEAADVDKIECTETLDMD